MYFLLSKLLLYFILPLNWIFVLFILCVTTKSKKRRARYFIAGLSLLYIFSNNFLFNQIAGRWDIEAHDLKNTDKYSCVMVLGGFAGEGLKGEGMFNTAADRFIQGVKLYKAGKASHILITGGNGRLLDNQFKESTWVKTQLQAFKVPDTAILIENNSRNTIENARFSKTILEKAHLNGPFLLITSAFHMRRAAMIFKKEHINVVPYPCNFITNRSGRYSFDDCFVPDSEILGRWPVYLKEFVGYAVNSFNG